MAAASRLAAEALALVSLLMTVSAFPTPPLLANSVAHGLSRRSSRASPQPLRMSSQNASAAGVADFSSMVTSRFPTSPEDQVRQASIALQRASLDGKKRHSVRLLLPIIGATELDDWPGGAKQMMDAASPLIRDVLKLSLPYNETTKTKSSLDIDEGVIDEADGVRALFSRGDRPVDDSCAVLLPSADTVGKLQNLDGQVGPKRNLMLVNAQWRRKTDFGLGLFGGRDEKIGFVEGFEPTFHCSNTMVEGENVRTLRAYPGPWRVFIRVVDESDATKVDWVEIGTKDLLPSKTKEWEAAAREEGEYDGGRLFDFGIPSYREVEEMIVSREGYTPKSLSERAQSALTFIKDTA